MATMDVKEIVKQSCAAGRESLQILYGRIKVCKRCGSEGVVKGTC